MTRRWLQPGVLFVGMVVVCLLMHGSLAASSSSSAPDNQTELLETLQDLVSQLRTLRQDYYQQRTQDNTKLQETQKNVRLLETQVAELRQQEAELDAEIHKYRGELETMTVEAVQRTHARNVIAGQISAFAVHQEDEIRKGIPYQQTERIARMGATRADANETAQLSTAEQLGHVWSYTQEELRLTGSSETYSERAAAEGDLTPYARYFRVGQWMLGYVTEDGRHAALWLPRFTGGAWEPIIKADRRKQIRSAVEILDRHQAPEFVALPIVTGPWLVDRMGP